MNAGLDDQLLITDVLDPNAKRVRKSGSIPVIDLSFQDFSLFSRHFLKGGSSQVGAKVAVALYWAVVWCTLLYWALVY